MKKLHILQGRLTRWKFSFWWGFLLRGEPKTELALFSAQGMAAPLATVALFNAVLFGSWGALERMLGHADGEAGPFEHCCLLLKAAAGVYSEASVFLRAPPLRQQQPTLDRLARTPQGRR